jgi:hypothetical protein
MHDLILDFLKARLSSQQLTWLAETSSAQILPRYTAASRRLGKVALQLEPEEKARLRKENPDLLLDQWGIDEAGRAVLLLEAVSPNETVTPKVLEWRSWIPSRRDKKN